MKTVFKGMFGSFILVAILSSLSFAGPVGPRGMEPGGGREEGAPLPHMMMHDRPGMGCGPEHMPFVRPDLAALGLDEKQTLAIREIDARFVKDQIRRRANIEIAELELKEMLDQESVALAAVEAKVKQLGSLKTEMRLLHIKALEEIKSKLTRDQKKKLRELVEAGPRPGREHSSISKK